MEIIYSKRLTGKTAALVRRLRENPDAYLVCSNAAEAARIVCTFYMGEELSSRVIAFQDAQVFLRGRNRDTEILVDNIDQIMSTLFSPCRVSMMTATEGK